MAGVQLSPKCAPSTIVMPAELFSLAVALTALTLYTQADQHRGWVAPESVANAMRAWVFMPRALGNAAWGAVTVKDVGDTLTSFKPDGTHSVIGGLLRCLDTQLGKLTTAGLMFLMSWLPPTLIPIDATAEARCAFATSNSPRALLLSRKDVYYFLRGVALTNSFIFRARCKQCKCCGPRWAEYRGQFPRLRLCGARRASHTAYCRSHGADSGAHHTSLPQRRTR